jgi:uncharacterized protein (TIGR02996 family)
MSDEKGLLAAIWDQPHDDAPRLVYADWLEENGQPERAEFIRVQCELARLGEWDESPRTDELEARENKLWAKHRKAWRAALPEALRRDPFHRGFPAPQRTFRAPAPFAQLTAADLAGAPSWRFTLKSVRDKHAELIAGAPALARTTRLDLREDRGRLSTAAIDALARGALANLEWLSLDNLLPGDAGVEALVSADVPHLRGVMLDGNQLTDAAVERLGAWRCRPRLEELYLGQNNLGDPSLDVIASSPVTRGLRSLVIGDNPGFTAAGLIRLIESPVASSLAVLQVAGSAGATPEFAEALAASQQSRALRTLTLPFTPLGDRGVAAILHSPHLQDLGYLNVQGCGQRAGKVVRELDARFGGYVSGWGGHRRSK